MQLAHRYRKEASLPNTHFPAARSDFRHRHQGRKSKSPSRIQEQKNKFTSAISCASAPRACKVPVVLRLNSTGLNSLFRSCVRLEFKILELSRIEGDGPIGCRVNLHVLTTSFAANISFDGDSRVAQRSPSESQTSQMAAERPAEEKY